jgi:hypothetical protein
MDGKEARLSPSDITSEDLVLESIILDKNGEPTERWTISGRDWVGDYPTRYPNDWLSEMLVYYDDTPMSPSEMVEELRNTRKPLNWVLCIISLLEKYGRRRLKNKPMTKDFIIAENEQKIKDNEKETQRVSGEIERAKREGNVSEEERLKVQMTRLIDERTNLDSIRRELEREYVPSSPAYTSSSPVAGEEEVEQVRGAVSSFNAKMLEKYGDNDQEIPESYENSPRAPSSPAYSSIFEGGGQRRAQSGGGGGGGGGGKFIPQIPMSVLDNYLNSKYGVSSKHTHISNSSGIMTGGTNTITGGGLGIPTMNIPVVATMPMAGMMPIQQQSQQSRSPSVIPLGSESRSARL